MIIPDIAIGSIAAALIAALVGVIGLIISKENKISEFRQNWIDALRSEIGAMISNLTAIRGASIADHPSKQELYETTKNHFVAANQALVSIRLRLNPKEPESIFILSKLIELEKLMDIGKDIDVQSCKQCESDIISSAHVLLKKEWLRVRRGERLFVMANTIGTMLVIGMVLWLLVVCVASP